MKSKKSSPKKLNFFIGLISGIVLVLAAFFIFVKFFSPKMASPENEYLRNCESPLETVGCSSGEVCCDFTLMFYGHTRRCANSADQCLSWVDGKVVKTY